MRRIDLLVISAIITYLILIVFIPPFIDFSAWNPHWNGYDKFVEYFNMTIINRPSDSSILDNAESKILILIPYKTYTEDELTMIKRFLELGGCILLMDDYGYGNQILEYLNAPVRITGYMLIDPLYYYKSPKLPKIIYFNRNISILQNISSIVLNHASSIEILNPAETTLLAYSSKFSYLDIDENGRWSPTDIEGPHPVFVFFRYKMGSIYVLSDPSISINSMIELGDNLKLFKKLFNGKKILIDQFHIKRNIHSKIRSMIIQLYNYVSSRPTLLSIITSLITLMIVLYISKETMR